MMRSTGIPYTPTVPAHLMKTYAAYRRPVAERSATCEEVECVDYIHGWTCVLAANDVRVQAIRSTKYRFIENPLDGLIEFVFAPGQPCFKKGSHTIIPEHTELYVVRDGDQRGNPRRTSPRKHTRGEFWVEEFSEHLDKMEGQSNG
jgi:hypothetical protein